MTKEEAIKIIEYTFINADGHLKPLDFDYGDGKGVVEALKMAIEALSKPSLPSNLDEAAEEFGKRQGVELAPFAKKFFKAGAEWMAGQGVKFDTEMSWFDSFGFQIGWPEDTSIFDCFNEGDNVVVQIRKK